MSTATVINIQRFSLHDGPGIRTTVFLKGCPLTCLWCHNPESMDFRPEPMVAGHRCIGCELCAPVCRHGLTGRVDGDPLANRPDARCDRCGECADACPAEARRLVGRRYETEELLAEIRRDAVYQQESGGGVTFSGGEPLAGGNAPVVLECLQALTAAGVHTAVDTCGHIEGAVLHQAAELADLFLFDLKLMDPERHRQATGQDNRRILENLETLLASGARVWIRVPLIPAVTDDRENLEAMGRFLRRLSGSGPLPPVHLLPWHGTAADKYRRLGRDNPLPQVAALDETRIRTCAGWLEDSGLTVRCGG